MIICCADTPRGIIQYYVDDVAKNFKIPYCYCSPHNIDKISVGPLIIPGKTKLYSDMLPKDMFERNASIEAINSNFKASVIDCFNALAAKVLTTELLKYITNYKECRLTEKIMNINTDDWSISWYE